MSLQYAKDQPEGFVNKLERVAIIGVRSPTLSTTQSLTQHRLAEVLASI